MFGLKFTEELCVITRKDDAIFKEKSAGGLKNDIRNLVNFHASSHKSENVHCGVMGSFRPKHIKF